MCDNSSSKAALLAKICLPVAESMDFQALQRDLCAHLRNPKAPAPEGWGADSLELYSGLVYRNIESFLSLCFAPVRVRAGQPLWHRLVRGFIRSERTVTPIFHELPGLFVLWLSEEGLPAHAEHAAKRVGVKNAALLEQLAHFLWVRYELDFATDYCPETVPLRDVLAARPIWSPLCWPLRYDWPVHRLPKGAVRRGEYLLLVWRDSDDVVRWQEVAAATMQLAELLQKAQGQLTGAEIVQQLSGAIETPDEASLRQQVCQEMERLCGEGLILGTAP